MTQNSSLASFDWRKNDEKPAVTRIDSSACLTRRSVPGIGCAAKNCSTSSACSAYMREKELGVWVRARVCVQLLISTKVSPSCSWHLRHGLLAVRTIGGAKGAVNDNSTHEAWIGLANHRTILVNVGLEICPRNFLPLSVG